MSGLTGWMNVNVSPKSYVPIQDIILIWCSYKNDDGNIIEDYGLAYFINDNWRIVYPKWNAKVLKWHKLPLTATIPPRDY